MVNVRFVPAPSGVPAPKRYIDAFGVAVIVIECRPMLDATLNEVEAALRIAYEEALRRVREGFK